MSQKKLSTVFGKFHKFILDIAFPVCCIGCGKENEWLCEKCAAGIKIKSDHVCGVCEKMITPDGRTCLNCKKTNPLNGLTATTFYSNFLVARLVHLYKYRFVSDLNKQLGNLMITSLQKTDIPLADIVVPVPLHSARLRWRGFNQSALLAKHIAFNLLPQNQINFGENILVRNRRTPTQMKITDRKNREQNVRGAFFVKNPERIKNKIVLLIDDIATTGSTIFECARVLKKAGAKEIYAAVIARQETKKKT